MAPLGFPITLPHRNLRQIPLGNCHILQRLRRLADLVRKTPTELQTFPIRFARRLPATQLTFHAAHVVQRNAHIAQRLRRLAGLLRKTPDRCASRFN